MYLTVSLPQRYLSSAPEYYSCLLNITVLLWASLSQVSHPATGEDISHRDTAKVFTDVVVKVWVAMEEGEGSLATGCQGTLCFSFSSFINEELSCVGKKTNLKPSKNPTKQNPTDVWKVSSAQFCSSLEAEAWEDNSLH